MEEKDVDIKARFRKWMSKTKKEDGEPYSENTINSYCNAMNNAPEKLEIDHQYQKPIFAYTDIHEYNKVKEIIFTAPNFDAVNKEAGNQALKYGMILYNQFLNEVFNNKNILAHNETLQTNNLKSKLADLLEHTHNLILRKPISRKKSRKPWTRKRRLCSFILHTITQILWRGCGPFRRMTRGKLALN